MTSLAVNGRYLGQPVTGVQRYALEVTAALQDVLGSTNVVVLQPPSADPLRSRLWEWGQLARAARGATGSATTLNLCNWGPVRGLDHATVVVHDAAVHEMSEGFSRPYRALVRTWTALLRHSEARIVTVSERSRAALEALLDKAVAVAPCGVDQARALEGQHRGQNWLHEQDLATDAQPYALFVGAHDLRKNFAFAVSLIPALRQRGLLLVATHRSGASSLRDANLSPTPSGIRLIADPTDDQLWALYGGASVLLHPSKYEGFGLPMLEAAAVGTPFLSSPVGAAEELAISDSQVLPLDLKAWACGLDMVLIERESWSVLSRARAAEYSWTRSAQAILMVVNR